MSCDFPDERGPSAFLSSHIRLPTIAASSFLSLGPVLLCRAPESCRPRCPPRMRPPSGHTRVGTRFRAPLAAQASVFVTQDADGQIVAQGEIPTTPRMDAW